ncbi:hypothetical protein SLS62_005869 [Diatrype stigma]|uniref:Uncharacterized protein n=1 Tax=Diatrype stigma TaxID=117547 RepID=A0AAN9UU18_9PEZI
MATNANLPAGQFITSLGGKRCTAIPKTAPAAAQPTTALPGTPPAASPAAPSPTEALPTPAAPAEAVPPPPPPAEEAPPAATSPIAPPADTGAATTTPTPAAPAEAVPPPPPAEEAPPADTGAITTTPAPAAGAPATEPAPAPAPSPSPSPDTTNGQDGSFIEAAPSTPSQSEEASPGQQEPDMLVQSAPTDTDVAPTSTADVPAPAATETDLGATAASDATVQTTPSITAADGAAASMTMPSTLVSSTTAPAQNTAGLGAPSNSAEAEGAAGPTAAAPFNNTMTTAAIAGAVVGGLAILSLLGFLIFFLRRRSKRRRRSTLLTSMFGDPGFRGGEKGAVAASPSSSTAGAYTINRTSLGPTPASEKLKNSVVFGFKRFRGRLSNITHGRSGSPHPTVDLDRGTSQFGPPQSSASSSRSRSSSRSAYVDGNDNTTAKERFLGWWGRLSRSGPPKSNRSVNEPFAEARAIRRVSNEILAPKPQQPDFNTLLKMDEEAAQRAADGTSKHRSTMGSDHFLGGLGFDYVSAMGAGPVSDDKALEPPSQLGRGSSVRHDSATIPPLAFPNDDDDGRINPFSDANAVGSGGPTTYVQDLRRSRGRSATTSNLGNNYAAAVMAARKSNNNNRRSSSYGFISNTNNYNNSNSNNHNNRESGMSVDSVDMAYKRNTKFRSDPFDLDRPELFSASSSRAGSRDSRRRSSSVGTAGVRFPPRARAHSRGASSSRVGSWTSEYSAISEEDSGATALAITTTANTLANARARASAGARASVNVVHVKRNTRGPVADAGFDGWSEPGPDVGGRSLGRAM